MFWLSAGNILIEGSDCRKVEKRGHNKSEVNIRRHSLNITCGTKPTGRPVGTKPPGRRKKLTDPFLCVQLARKKPPGRRAKAADEVGSRPWVQAVRIKLQEKEAKAAEAPKQDPAGSISEIKPVEESLG